MSESNNVKFAEADGKWLWKRYDVNGSVIFRSSLFNTEREAREDYELNGEKNNGGPVPSDETPESETSSTESTQSQDSAPEGGAESTVGTATGEENQQADNDNSAGSASL